MVVGSADSSGQPRVQLGESFVWREAVGMGSVAAGHPVFLQERPNLATIAETSAIEGVPYVRTVHRQTTIRTGGIETSTVSGKGAIRQGGWDHCHRRQYASHGLGF